MDREAELARWRERDRADLDAAMRDAPPGRAEALVRRAILVFGLAGAATGGEKRVAPLGPPSRITSTAEWMEDLRQDLSRETFFERHVLELRPDLLPDHGAFVAEPVWPAIRAGVARTGIFWRDTRRLLARAAEIDQGAERA